MKRFIIRVALEAVAIVAATITATQLVKAGHPALGLSVISVYGVFNLYRLSIEKIDGQRAQNDLLKGRLSLKEEQVRRLEATSLGARPFWRAIFFGLIYFYYRLDGWRVAAHAGG